MHLEPSQLKYFADLIKQELGIVYAEDGYYQLDKRIQDVALKHGFSDAKSFWAAAQTSLKPEYKKSLMDEATNNETLFFRDPDVFTALSEQILPSLFSQGFHPLRIWSCACSRGQEAYSIAMTLQEHKGWGIEWTYEIDCTDISASALAAAQAGVYSQLEVNRGLSQEQLKKYFEMSHQDSATSDNTKLYTVRRQLQQNMSFFSFNIIGDWHQIGIYDIIFCRNVLIYQDISSKTQVLNHLFRALKPGGYLFLGGAESMVGLSDAFERSRSGRATFYRKPEHSTSASHLTTPKSA